MLEVLKTMIFKICSLACELKKLCGQRTLQCQEWVLVNTGTFKMTICAFPPREQSCIWSGIIWDGREEEAFWRDKLFRWSRENWDEIIFRVVQGSRGADYFCTQAPQISCGPMMTMMTFSGWWCHFLSGGEAWALKAEQNCSFLSCFRPNFGTC